VIEMHQLQPRRSARQRGWLWKEQRVRVRVGVSRR
jgi:hypothetical protein